MSSVAIIIRHARVALIGTFILLGLALLLYIVVEPAIGRAVVNQFTVSQLITDEISFSTPSGAVAMVGSINGLTGGNATGTTYVVVQTNDVQGYNMTIDFDDSPAMNSTTTTDVIFDYKYATNTPDFNFVASSSAIFAYTVTASNTSDVDPTFQDNGAWCGGGGGNLDDRCWAGPSTTPEMIVFRNTSASEGATTTIKFRVYVPNSPSPALDAAYYRATATLTALNN